MAQSDTDSSSLEPFVQKLTYRVKLDAEERAAILALPFSAKVIERSQYFVQEHEVATQSCLMLSGYSVRSKIVAAGSRQIVAIHMKGEMVDLQNSLLEKADHSVQMLSTSKVAMIPRDAIIKLAEDWPRVGRAMWIDTLVDASIFREWIASAGRRDARTRIAHLLCEFSVRLKVAGLAQETGYELPMTQEQLGDATGMTAVHVNRMLKSLEREGLIDRTSSRSIRIGDWRKLAVVGDFDSNYLHLRNDEPSLEG
jgi:CRP-like cAMP-binding protein